MFVVDTFPKNPDRNNGNWGVLMKVRMAYELPRYTPGQLALQQEERIGRRGSP